MKSTRKMTLSLLVVVLLVFALAGQMVVPAQTLNKRGNCTTPVKVTFRDAPGDLIGSAMGVTEYCGVINCKGGFNMEATLHYGLDVPEAGLPGDLPSCRTPNCGGMAASAFDSVTLERIFLFDLQDGIQYPARILIWLATPESYRLTSGWCEGDLNGSMCVNPDNAITVTRVDQNTWEFESFPQDNPVNQVLLEKWPKESPLVTVGRFSVPYLMRIEVTGPAGNPKCRN